MRVQRRQEAREVSQESSRIKIGDKVRVRVADAPSKLSVKHKSHLGFISERGRTKPVNWSRKTLTVLEVRHYRTLKKFKYKLNDGKWYHGYEMLKIPANTERFRQYAFRQDRRVQNKVKPGVKRV